MASQYIHVFCEEYSLLLDIRWVEEVINTAGSCQDAVDWRGRMLPYMDLTRILMGHAVENNRHCIILKSDGAGNDMVGLGVGQVANIESIKDEDFRDLPHLDFPFNEYFDKAYIPKAGGKCIYRLKNLVHVKQANA